jgi:hypothetical protein
VKPSRRALLLPSQVGRLTVASDAEPHGGILSIELTADELMRADELSFYAGMDRDTFIVGLIESAWYAWNDEQTITAFDPPTEPEPDTAAPIAETVDACSLASTSAVSMLVSSVTQLPQGMVNE